MDQDNRDNDENIRYQVTEVFNQLVIMKVISTDILPQLLSDRIVDKNDSSRIRSMNERGEIQKATEELILVIDKSTEKGKWKSFMDALKSAEYELVVNVLEDKICNDDLEDEAKERLICLFNQRIINELNLRNDAILAYLYEREVITTSDRQKILARNCNSDQVLELLSCISRRKSNWYELFLESLLNDEKPELVELISPEFLEKRMARESEKLQEPEKESSKEYVMYGEGEPYDSGDYAGNMPSINLLSTEKVTKLNQDDASPNILDESSFPKTFTKEMKQLNTDKDTDTMNIQHELPAPEVMETVDYDDIVLKPIELRSYQIDLCKDALAGENTIICAPTGSGKTIVAMNIIKEHFQKKQGIKKVAFLVNQVALAEQQFSLCKEYLNLSIERITGDIQMTTKISLSKLIEANDVLVMTAQILVDAIKEKDLKDITAFSMIVFDECHHAKGKHPYNQIMHMYMNVKFQYRVGEGDKYELEELVDPPLPQVIGLTASVGVGKAKKEEEAKEHIIDLCANLDVRKVCEVSGGNVVDLQKHTPVPVWSTEIAQTKTNDVYHQVVSEIMNKIERDMKNSSYLKEPDEEIREFIKLLKSPANKKHDSYTQWLSHLQRGIAMLDDVKTRKFFVTCQKMLKVLHSALIINSDCRSSDSYQYIEEEFSQAITPNQSSKDREILKKYYTEKKDKLLSICKDPNNVNPKLEKLKKMIVEGFAENPDSRAIVFAKTLALVHKLKLWMEETPELRDLNLKPETVTGARATVEKGGMTRNQQVEVLECFKSGDSKLIIATSVAEEGLDIQKCNLVIRYDHVTNEISMIQSRGRARAANSEYKLVASQDSNSAKKEGLNLCRELLMKKALAQLKEVEPQKLDQIIRKKQKQLKLIRDMERRTKEGKLLSADEFELRCYGCNKFACLSTDVRSIRESQFTVTDKKFRERYKDKSHPSPIEFHGFQKKSKIYCKECGHDWGIEAIHRNVTFPLVKISSFTIVDGDGRKTTAKKWIKAPFRIASLEEEYFEREFEEASGNSLMDGYDSTDDN